MRSVRDGQIGQIIVLRSLPLDSDSRTNKMISAYRAAGYAVRALAWNRGKTGKADPAITYFEGQGQIGAKWRNLSNYLRWCWFLVTELIGRRHEYSTVHVIDFDTAIVGVPVGKLLGKRIVFDGYDHFGSIRENRLARALFDKLERGLMRIADLTILPSRQRVGQYGVADLDPVIISNIPDDMPTPTDGASPDAGGALTIAYVGTLQGQHRGLEYLPAICRRNPGIRVVVGGLGELAPQFGEAARQLDNLQFLGQLSYDDALNVMASADILYGPYLLTADYHEYASPNKMYEHVLLGRPLITNDGTPVGDFVRDNETGYLFDGSEKDLERVVQSLTHAGCAQTGRRARALWDKDIRFQRERELGRFFGELASVLNTGRRGVVN
jgi:glycosyltransferase involved in cell wall biosynthesis